MCLKDPLGLPRSPRTEWEVSRRPPAKMSQSGPPDLRMTQVSHAPMSWLKAEASWNIKRMLVTPEEGRGRRKRAPRRGVAEHSCNSAVFPISGSASIDRFLLSGDLEIRKTLPRDGFERYSTISHAAVSTNPVG